MIIKVIADFIVDSERLIHSLLIFLCENAVVRVCEKLPVFRFLSIYYLLYHGLDCAPLLNVFFLFVRLSRA